MWVQLLSWIDNTIIVITIHYYHYHLNYWFPDASWWFWIVDANPNLGIHDPRVAATRHLCCTQLDIEAEKGLEKPLMSKTPKVHDLYQMYGLRMSLSKSIDTFLKKKWVSVSMVTLWKSNRWPVWVVHSSPQHSKILGITIVSSLCSSIFPSEIPKVWW